MMDGKCSLNSTVLTRVQFSVVNHSQNIVRQISRTYSSWVMETEQQVASSHFSLSPCQALTILFFHSTNLPIFNTEYKWNHLVWIL